MLAFTPHSRKPVRPVNHVQFGIISPVEMIALSVAKIEHVELFDKHGQKQKGGLIDRRMGCVDKNDHCATCLSKIESCPGHFGHIELARPLYNPGWQFDKVKKVIETFCHHCSRLRLSPTVTHVTHGKGAEGVQTTSVEPRNKYEEMLKLHPKARLDFAWRWGKIRPACEWKECGKQLLPLKRVRTKLQFDNGHVLDAGQAYDILRKISDEDWTLLGMDCMNARPEWMILTVLPVPPPPVRPSIYMEGSGRGEDDLTLKLFDIIKFNEMIKHPGDGVSAKSTMEYAELLQYHVTTYIDNDVRGNDAATQKSGRPLKSIKVRLKGKEGRLRSNLMGKRVDFSARTVITGDPHLEIDQVGVPLSIARNLTFPEKAFEANLDKLQRLVDNGTNYPGAKYLVHNMERKDLRYMKHNPIVQIGDTVERHLLNDDPVVFNRQPSLHKMSMMGHRVRVMPHSTFRLNLSVTTPYNADFDGDEMNLHCPQSALARAEIANLTMVPNLIVSPQSNRPVCGIVQDALLGTYELTGRNTFLDSAAFTDLCMFLPAANFGMVQPAILKPKRLWTGKQIFSMLLPDTLSYAGYHSAHPEGENLDHSPGDTKVIIRRGQLLCGIICKRAIGPTGGGLVHILAMDEGPAVVKRFMDGCQNIANQFLMRTGFSVGIGDGMLSAEGLREVTHTVLDAGKLVDDNMTRDSAGKQAQGRLSRQNNFRRMVAAGSKGSSINISQITACVGPQNVEGKGIPRGFRNRTLPHFSPHDNRASARGFVMNSYSRGLNPSEFFFHAMGGREGIIDTAVKSVTWDTKIVVYQETRGAMYVDIGRWIDMYLLTESERVEVYHEQMNLELLRLSDKDVPMIPTTDEHGHVSWSPITAITRHDAGETIYRVSTRSGRKVTVTAGKSLLIWDDSASVFSPKPTQEVKIGDRMPVTATLPGMETLEPSDEGRTYDLNEANGIFLGICLASAQKSADGVLPVEFTLACNGHVREYVIRWFALFDISWKSIGDNMVGTSSSLMYVFQTEFGNCQHVPAIAFWAPEPFVKGLLNGYMSAIVPFDAGASVVVVDGISPRMAEGLAMLLTRVGVFASICGTYLEFHGTSARKLAACAILWISPSCADQLAAAGNASDAIDFYHRANDVVLDDIVSIEPLAAAAGQKMYDLTVPATNNFALANGLQVYDTAETGYLQRKLVKAHEDAMVAYDGTVRNGRGNVLQWHYGEDDMDGTAIEKQSLRTILLNTTELAQQFADSPEELAQLTADRDALRALLPSMQDTIALPSNIRRILFQAEAMYPISAQCKPVSDVGDKRTALLSELSKLGLESTSVYAMHIRSVLATKQLVKDRISNEAFSWLADLVIKKYRKGIVHPGEMVGVVAAQSIGEPATQLTLNTFHLAGVGSKKLTLGIPRLKELLNTSQNIRTPSMTLYTVPGERSNGQLRYLKSEIEHVALEMVVKSMRIIFDDMFAQGSTNVTQDVEWVSLFLSVPDDTNPDWTQISPWMLRIVLDRSKVWEYCLTMKGIVQAIQRDTGDDVFCMWSDDNDPELVIHFRVVASNDEPVGDSKTKEMPMDIYLRQLQDQLLAGVTLKGVRGISAVSLETKVVPKSQVDGSITYEKTTTIETEGINLADVCALPDIDALRVSCNNPVEILQMLGVEAARAVLLQEIRNVIEFDGSYINVRHLMLLCDIMTDRGGLMAITRHGINRTEAGPLAKSSFEETNDILFNAAVGSERDSIQGVSESLIFGQMARIGTGSFDVIERKVVY